MTKLKFDLGKMYLPLVKIHKDLCFFHDQIMYIPIIKAHYCLASVPCETRLPIIWCFRIVLIMIQFFKVTCSITIHTQTYTLVATGFFLLPQLLLDIIFVE